MKTPYPFVSGLFPKPESQMNQTIRNFLPVFALLSLLAISMLYVAYLKVGGPPKESCEDGMCDWYSFTYQQCEALCIPAQVKSYDPNAYWFNGRPTSRYPSPPCLCAPGEPK